MSRVQRRDGLVCAAVKVVEVGAETQEPSVTRNLGLSGLFLVTKKRWAPGTVTTLLIRYRYVEVEVRVRQAQVQPDGVGLEFVELNAAARQTLRLIIDGLLADGAWLDDRRRALRRDVAGAVVWRPSGWGSRWSPTCGT